MIRGRSAGVGNGTRHRVVVVGGGFGGLQAILELAGASVDVTLIDRNNYHLFQPLTYQVATGALSPDEIGKPLRTIFRRQRNVRVLMADVTGVDLEHRHVLLHPSAGGPQPETVPYDTLVVAAGSSYAYFGHDEWRSLARGEVARERPNCPSAHLAGLRGGRIRACGPRELVDVHRGRRR
jgi:NADH dehydrogenase FAD-containing subunit